MQSVRRIVLVAFGVTATLCWGPGPAVAQDCVMPGQAGSVGETTVFVTLPEEGIEATLSTDPPGDGTAGHTSRVNVKWGDCGHSDQTVSLALVSASDAVTFTFPIDGDPTTPEIDPTTITRTLLVKKKMTHVGLADLC